MSRPADPVLGVSALIERLQDALASEFGDVWVEGEIGSLHRSAPGHLYLDLRDADAQLEAVLFRSSAARLSFELEEGMRVRAHGRLDVWPERGALRLVVDELHPVGEGALRAAFERLKARLSEEGLFDAAGMRPLPFLPRRIGVVTSLRGAALPDFVRALRRRCVAADVVVCHASVQGEGAWREVVRALHLLDADPTVETIVLTRGGGSQEDLWTFNREEVVRAVSELTTPVVSAIGHEVDVVLTDLAADARAATPTAAAALVVPDSAELERRVAQLELRLLQRVRARGRERRQRLEAAQRGLVHPAQRLSLLHERLTAAAARLGRGGERARERRRARLQAASGRLEALSPLAVLGRGYALVRRELDGAILRSSRQVSEGDAIRVRLARGALRAAVTGTAAEDPPGRGGG